MKMIADRITSQYQDTGGNETSIYQVNSQGDAELKKLLMKNNELLEAILEKPVIDDGDVLRSVRRSYYIEANRGGINFRDPVLG